MWLFHRAFSGGAPDRHRPDRRGAEDRHRPYGPCSGNGPGRWLFPPAGRIALSPRATTRQDSTADGPGPEAGGGGRDPGGSAAGSNRRRDPAATGEQRHSSLLLVVSLAVVAWGTFRLLEPSAAVSSLHPAARGSLVLGLIAFGGASLALLGIAPARPPSGSGALAKRCRRMFFPAADREGPGDDAAGPRTPPGGSGTRGAGVRLGWARLAASLGVLLLLLAGLLSLTPYSAAALMALAGSAGVLALRAA